MGVFGIPVEFAAGLAIVAALLGITSLIWSIINPRDWQYYIALLIPHIALSLVVLTTWWSSAAVHEKAKIFLGFLLLVVEIPTVCYIVAVAKEAIEENE